MPKGRRLETILTTLVERVSPGDVRIAVPKFAMRPELRDPELQELASGLGKANRYEVSFATRGLEDSFCGSSVRQAVEHALDSLERPDGTNPDPFLPAWYRLSRYQREVVNETLKEHASRHMATAAAMKLAHKSDAEAEWRLADAFRAAIDCLHYVDVDDEGHELPNPPLKGDKQLPTSEASPSRSQLRKKQTDTRKGRP